MYTIVPVLVAAIGQVQRDPHAMSLAIGFCVEITVCLLARMWAHHVRASRGR